MFSSRVPTSLEPNRVTRAIRHARARGRPLIDLTVTNPTVVGFEYSPSLLQPLAWPRALEYVPEPFGLPEARRAVAAEYARRGITVAWDRVVLTASTSEAYSLLFKLLCGPHDDAVLVPVPSYPLFEHLTRLDGVRSIPYRLEYHGRWLLDFDDLDQAWSRSVRALVAVTPNNPTGSVLSGDDVAELSRRSADRNTALMLDEVFADYPLGAEDFSSVLHRGTPQCLTFSLGGLSKSVGLPQVKLGWIAVHGPDALVRAALDRLELICDTYLSVSSPVQIATSALIESGTVVRRQIQERVRRNYRELRSRASAYPAIEILHADAGWSAVVRVPSTRPEEDLIVELIERDDVLVHPGFYFDFDRESFVVVSLLTEPHTFDRGIRRLLERVNG